MTDYKSGVDIDDFHADTREFFVDRTVAVCGGGGFIGSHVVEQLLALGARPVVPTRRNHPPFLEHLQDAVSFVNCDLEDLNNTRAALSDASVVMDLAARIGGIKFNETRPASQFDQNLRPFMNTIRAAADNNVDRLLVTSSACVYTRHCPVPTPESEGFVGHPEDTNVGYGWAKRMEEFLAWAAAQEYGLSIAIARPYNAYGPRDDFRDERSHVIPSLISKALRTTEGRFTVWGNGSATRAFLYVDDFARGLLEITARYPAADALNLGGDEMSSIHDLAHLIADLVSEIRGDRVEPVFGNEGPTGQPVRGCDTSRLKSILKFSPDVSLEDGLQRTIQWFVTHENHALRTRA